jgi:hypothetical protein
MIQGPPLGYISSEMVTILSALTRLEDMRLVSGYPDSDSNSTVRPPAPLMRSLLPALKGLDLRSNGEYLDDFVARIDVLSINSFQNSAQRSTLLCR